MRSRSVVACVALFVGLAACGGSDGAPDGASSVVVTTSILGDIVSNVAGDGIAVSVLMPLGVDPHEYQPSSRQIALLEEADLVVANGVGLEEGLEDVLEAVAGNGVRVVYAADAVDLIALDEMDEDEHGAFDPHIWMDPARMGSVARMIGGELDDLAPESDSAVRSETYVAELEALVAEIDDTLSSVQDRMLVTNHDSLRYFAERFDFEIVGTVIPAASTDARPSSADLAELVDVIEREGVTAIFADNTDPTALADAVAGEVGFEIEVVELFTGSLGSAGSGAETYIEMMRSNARLVTEALG